VNERDAFVRTTTLGAVVTALAGAAGLWLWGRWDWAAGFGVGALVSLGNFRLIAHAVGGMSGTEDGRVAHFAWRGALLRFGVTGVALLVALLLFRVSFPALAAGLLVAQVAMIALWVVRAVRTHA
jgi:hypothetical protein